MIKIILFLACVFWASGDTTRNEILAKKIAEILSSRQKNVIFLRTPTGGLPVLIPLDFDDDVAMDRIFCGNKNKTKFEIIQQTLENLYASTIRPVYFPGPFPIPQPIYPPQYGHITHPPHYEQVSTTHAPHYEHSTTTKAPHEHYEHSTTHAPHYKPSTTHAPHQEHTTHAPSSTTHHEHHEHYETTLKPVKKPIATTKKPFWWSLFTTPRPIYFKTPKEPLNEELEEKHEEVEEKQKEPVETTDN